jgi:hypothetical protein
MSTWHASTCIQAACMLMHVHVQTCIRIAQEVEDIVKSGVEEGVSPENMMLEVNGRKFAHDKTHGDCARMVVLSILRTIPVGATRKVAFSHGQELIKRWKAVIVRFIRSVSDQMDVLTAIETFAFQEEWKAHKLFTPLCKTLWDQDMIVEKAVFDWLDKYKESDGPNVKAVAKEIQPFIEFLQQDEEDDDE